MVLCFKVYLNAIDFAALLQTLILVLKNLTCHAFFQGCCGDDGSLMEVDGSHPARTLGLTTAELKHLLQNKEENPENFLLELEKHVLVRGF